MEFMVEVMEDLRNAIRAEAIKFADQLYDKFMSQIASALGGVFGASMPKPNGETPKRRERLSEERIEETLARIVALLESHPEGLRSEEIRAKLSLDKKTFQYAANTGKESDQIIQKGERRATTYLLPKVGVRAQAEGRVVKKKRG